MSISVRTISGDERRIPATQGTQHPDNATKPSWSQRSDARITLEMEGEEALANFRLGIDETMWDNEGKHADYGIGLKLVEQHNEFFTERQLGRDLYITYRIPNRWKQRGGVHRHVFTAIAAENETLASCPTTFGGETRSCTKNQPAACRTKLTPPRIVALNVEADS